MVHEKPSNRQQRLDNFLQYLEAAQTSQDDIMKYGIEAAHLYCDEVDGDWLETWGEDGEKTGSNFFIRNKSFPVR